jgi:hypothetical protein
MAVAHLSALPAMKLCMLGLGEKNLEIHHTSKACLKKGFKRPSKASSKQNQSMHTFFKPCAPLNPLTVTTPPPIHAGDKANLKANEILDGILHETLHEILDKTV